MLTILKKEFSSYFRSARGYAFLATNILLSGLFVTFCNLVYGSARIERAFELMAFAAIFTIPLLTIKLFAAERDEKTDTLLYSLPLSTKDIVLGKLLSTLLVIGIEVVLLITLPIILSAYGTINFASAFAAIFGFTIFSISYAAVCAFISAVSKKVKIAAITSYGLSVLIIAEWLIYSNIQNLPKVIVNSAFINIYDSFAIGAPSIFSTVFYISVAALFVYLTFYASSKKRATKKASPKPLVAIILSVVLVAANVSCALLPKKISTLDLSSNKAYSLSENTIDFISKIDEKVTVYVIDSDSSSVSTEHKLSLFDEYSKNLNVEYTTSSELYDELVELGYTEDTAITPYSILVKSDKRAMFIDAMNLYVYYHPDFGEMTYSTYNSYLNTLYQYAMSDATYYETFLSLYNNTVSYYTLEPMLASYIEYSLVDVIPTLYYMTSHGCLPMTSILGLTLTDMSTKELDLASISEMPNDLGSLIINAPSEDLTDKDAALLSSYLENGGAAIFITNPENVAMPNLMSLLQNYGVITTPELITVDQAVEVEATEGEEASVVYVASNIIDGIANPDHDSLYALSGESIPFVNANHITIQEIFDPSLIVTPIITSGNGAYIDGADIDAGTKNLAVAIEKETAGGTTEIAWFTGADTLLDENITLTNFYAIMYTTVWGIESFESELGEIAPTVMSEEMLAVTSSTATTFMLVTVVLTIGTIVIGIVVCNVRKRRKPVEDTPEE